MGDPVRDANENVGEAAKERREHEAKEQERERE